MNEILKRPDEMYCKNCGNLISNNAVLCPKCGIQVGELKSTALKPVAKDKTVAVLLAIFVGFWAWIYTWETDKAKFWWGLGVTIVTLCTLTIIFYIWVIIDAASRSNEFYLNYPNV